MQNIEPRKELSQHELNIIADNIEKLSKVAETLNASRLKQKTILLLLKHQTGLTEKNIKLVLDALPLLASEYLKPKQPTKEAGR